MVKREGKKFDDLQQFMNKNNKHIYYGALYPQVDAGADYILTQMITTFDEIHNFTKDCVNVGVNVPVVPGLFLIEVTLKYPSNKLILVLILGHFAPIFFFFFSVIQNI